MPKTEKMKIVYAGIGEENFYEIFKASFNQISNFIYANKENPHLVLTGGGTVGLSVDVLSWNADFEIINLLNGGVITIAAGSLNNFEDGKIAIVTISRPVAGINIGTLEIVDNIGDDENKLFVVMRRGSSLYLRSNLTVI